MGRSRLTVPTTKKAEAPPTPASPQPSGDTVISMIAAGVLEMLKPWLTAELDRRFNELKELAAAQTPQPAPELMTVKTITKEMGISAYRLNCWRAEGLIAPAMGGKGQRSNILYRRSDVEALMKERRTA